MTKDNRNTLKEFGKVVLLTVLGFIAIISAVGTWNAAALGAIGSFYGWVAGMNFIVEGFGIYKLWTKLFPKPNSDEDHKE